MPVIMVLTRVIRKYKSDQIFCHKQTVHKAKKITDYTTH